MSCNLTKNYFSHFEPNSFFMFLFVIIHYIFNIFFGRKLFNLSIFIMSSSLMPFSLNLLLHIYLSSIFKYLCQTVREYESIVLER
jgi:hypothetical protein